MIKKSIIWGLGLLFTVILPFYAFADQSIGFQEYFNKGVKAFREHDDQKAIRCFKIAQIYDPKDEELNKYLDILAQRGVVLELPAPSLPPEESIGFKYYFSEGLKAFQAHDYKKAVYYFNIAIIFNPDSKETDRYLRILAQVNPYLPLAQPQAETAVPKPVITVPVPAIIVQQPTTENATTEGSKPEKAVTPPAITVSVPPIIVQQPTTENATTEGSKPEKAVTPPAITVPVPAIIVQQATEENTAAEGPNPAKAVTQEVPVPAVIVRPQTYSPSVQAQPAAVVAPSFTLKPVQNSKNQPAVLLLSQITSNGQVKPKLQIEYHTSIILEAKNIQRYLVVDDHFIGIRSIGVDRLEIDALNIGTTFLHIWDDYGRHTLYVEVVFPKNNNSNELQAMSGIQHVQPFRVTYTNDWSTYYQGKDISALKRQSFDLNQTLAVTGETPYGYFDTSGSYTDFDSFSQFDTYTIGLSQIPLDGTSNFNLRGFDSVRYLSPLTMPGTRLRGAFADVGLLDDNLGLSVSHGQEQVPLGFISPVESQFNDSYIDAAKLTLFPTSQTDRYSFNFATAYGTDRPSYLSDHVYSLEGQHKFNDFLTLNAEEASDSSHDSTLASLRWENPDFKTGFNFRNIDKDYSTISTLPANQGETGVAWTTNGDFKQFSESTFVEAYQDHLDSSPDDTGVFNYDANGHLRTNFSKALWSDTDFNFIDTPGELSPQRSVQVNERLSRSFGIWNSQKGTVFGGMGFQNSHSADSNISNFDREDVIAGIQLPLTEHVSTYANYEYDWLDQPHNGGNTNPDVINAGFQYSKQYNPRFSVTSQLDYRDELGVQASNSGFLSGERSVIITSGFSYNPTPDVSVFADGDASRVLSHIGNPTYDDFEVHLGVRITFGGATYWDPLGTVSGIIFKDINGDGKYVAGDEGIAGVKVRVGDKETVTDKNGRYSVQVRAKGVTVYPVLDSLPGGLIFSTLQTMNVEVYQGRTTHADFGFTSQTGIYGIVFVDKFGTGVPNEGDKFIGKVKVILDGKIVQKSDAHGAFYFRKVSPGKHVISLDINSLALNMVPMVKLKNMIDVAEGTNYMFNIPVKLSKAEGDQE